METVDLSLLAAYPGEYRDALIAQLYTALQLEKEGITVIPGVKNKMNLHKLLILDGLKPFTGTFKSKKDFSYEPRVLEVNKAQRDSEVNPSEYIPTFMAAKRGSGENTKNMTIPFAQFMWEQYIKKVGNELNSQSVFHGAGAAAFVAFNAANAYAVGDLVKYTQDGELRYFEAVAITVAGESPDTAPAKWKWAGAKAVTKGYGKIITDEIAAAKVTPLATGAVDGTNAYGKQMLLFRSLPESVKLGQSGPVLIYQSMTDFEYLMDDYEDKVSKNFETIDGITYLAKTEKTCGIKPVSWLSGSRRLIATVAGNLTAGTDQLSDMNMIKTIEKHYAIEASLSFMIGFQINDLDVLRVSNQS
jgi:hypothetical protein